ncbi:MAG: hypothetical protein WD404_07000 [Solirubrobacterales bacterium]
MALHLGSADVRVIARNAEAPVFSPDGSRIALLGYPNGNRIGRNKKGLPQNTDLYVKSIGERRLRRLTNTVYRWESKPSWDPSGERLAYARNSTNEVLPFGFSNVVMEINRDGTCGRKLFDPRRESKGPFNASVYGPAWRPGPGREAGRIAC